MSRTRTQQLAGSLLGGRRGKAPFARVLQAGIDFGKKDPLGAVEKAMKRLRIAEPEELRARFALPKGPCLCHEVATLQVPSAGELDDAALLCRALLLGLCTPHFYDPRRPVLFTRASLGRRLELYVDRGFYA